jgi:hypothetical protein
MIPEGTPTNTVMFLNVPTDGMRYLWTEKVRFLLGTDRYTPHQYTEAEPNIIRMRVHRRNQGMSREQRLCRVCSTVWAAVWSCMDSRSITNVNVDILICALRVVAAPDTLLTAHNFGRKKICAYEKIELKLIILYKGQIQEISLSSKF